MLRYIFNTVSRYMLDFKYIIFYIYLLATLNSFVTMSSHSLKVSDVQVEHFTFPASVKPPGSCHHSLFLGGAGVRGLEIQGKFVKFTAIGVYLEDDAVKTLAAKWKGKTTKELNESVPFFRDIVTGPFEKFTQVTLILPLTGQQYSEKVAENCVAIWKAMGLYTDAEAKAIEKFLEVFKNETFAPGASILFTQSPKGSLTITFSKDMTVPEAGKAVIDNKLLSEAVLDSIIGKHGVSPSAKESIAARLSVLLKGGKDTNEETHECKKPEAEKTATTKECKKAKGDKLNGEPEIVV